MKCKLSQCELDVVYWLSLGKSYSDIAEILTISYAAVRQRTNGAKNKLGAQTIGGIIGIAFRKGILS